MLKRRWIIVALLGSVMISLDSAFDRFTSLASPQPSLQASSEMQLSQRSFLDGLQNLFQSRRPRREGIRRSGEPCAISPGVVETDRLWSDRPLFIWQGRVSQITLKEFDTGTVVWEQPIESTVQQIAYTGDALPPGLYQWEVLGDSNARGSFIFEVIGGDERTQITNQLQQLESQLSEISTEELALAKAEWFAQQNYWSDAFQMIYAIEQPADAVQQTRQEITNYVCPSVQTESEEDM